MQCESVVSVAAVVEGSRAEVIEKKKAAKLLAKKARTKAMFDQAYDEGGGLRKGEDGGTYIDDWKAETQQQAQVCNKSIATLQPTLADLLPLSINVYYGFMVRVHMARAGSIVSRLFVLCTFFWVHFAMRLYSVHVLQHTMIFDWMCRPTLYSYTGAFVTCLKSIALVSLCCVDLGCSSVAARFSSKRLVKGSHHLWGQCDQS